MPFLLLCGTKVWKPDGMCILQTNAEICYTEYNLHTIDIKIVLIWDSSPVGFFLENFRYLSKF